jgi:hypothetical protein
MLFEKVKDKEYKAYSFFDLNKKFDCVGDTKDGKKVSVSRFVLLTKSDFETLSNIDYESLTNDLVSVEHSAEYSSILSQRLLDILLAYDNTGNAKLFRHIIRLTFCFYQFCFVG